MSNKRLPCAKKTLATFFRAFTSLNMPVHQRFRTSRDEPISVIYGSRLLNDQGQSTIWLKVEIESELMSIAFHLFNIFAQIAVLRQIIS